MEYLFNKTTKFTLVAEIENDYVIELMGNDCYALTAKINKNDFNDGVKFGSITKSEQPSEALPSDDEIEINTPITLTLKSNKDNEKLVKSLANAFK
jgi:hypothetical protein